jgi:hypothetical protein
MPGTATYNNLFVTTGVSTSSRGMIMADEKTIIAPAMMEIKAMLFAFISE